MRLPSGRIRLLLVGAISAGAIAVSVAGELGDRSTVPAAGAASTQSPLAASTGQAGGPPLVIDPALPAIDPVPWTAVEWNPVPGAFGRRLEPGHDRIEGLGRGQGLVAWGRAGMPGRNQFDDMGAAYLSQDGLAWLTVPIDAGVGPRDASEIRVMASGPTGLLAFGGVCCSDEERPALWHSPDGRAWSRLPYPAAIGTGTVKSLVGAGDRYVAVGELDGSAVIWTSRDGIAWAPVGGDPRGFGPGGVNDVAVAPLGLIAGGWLEDGNTWDGAIWASADGETWERLPADVLIGVDDTVVSRIIVRSGGWFVIGWDGSHEERLRCQQAGRVASAAWPHVGPSITGDFSCGWGHEAHWITADAQNWVEVVPPAGLVPARRGELIEFRLVVPGGPGLVALGEGSEVGSSAIFVSQDGRTWQPTEPQRQLPGGDPVGLVVAGRSLLAIGTQPQVWMGAAR